MTAGGISFYSTESSSDQRRRLDFELVRRVQSGDQTAFRRLVEQYQNKVFSVVHGILRNREDTEDIAQVVFTRVYFAIGGFDCRCSLGSWICRIAINACYSHLRRLRVRMAYEAPVEPDAFGSENRFGASAQPAADSRTADRDLLNKLLVKLPEDERSLLILKEVEGHSVLELAQMMGASESAIKTRLFRARQKLLQAARRLSQRPALESDRQ